MTKQKVIVGLSGGVDSAVALLILLKNPAYKVEALFIKNWDDLFNVDHQCDWADDYRTAQAISKQLNVKLHFVSFEKSYFKQVFKPLILGYKNGITPNPDVICNRYIKFGIVTEYIKKKFSATFFATGHYCNFVTIENYHFLKMANDVAKDQSYFLSGTPIINLQKVLFPLGKLRKTQVRKIAKENLLINYARRDSTGICFIGERNFTKFLQQYIPPSSGEIIDYQSNQVVGKHQGIAFYTIGQRKRLNIKGATTPYYVCKKDIEKKRLFVVTPRFNPILWRTKIAFKNLLINFPFFFNQIAIPCQVKIRHLGKVYSAVCYPYDEIVHIIEGKIFALSAGQLITFHWNKICIASAEIILKE